MHSELVFGCAQQYSAQSPNEISALNSELIFRHIPGKLIERRPHSLRLYVRRLGRTLLDPVTCVVIGIAFPPARLRFLTASGLAFRPATGPLPRSYARVGTEPPPTNATRFLAHPRHNGRVFAAGEPSQTIFAIFSLDYFCLALQGNFSRAPKGVQMEYNTKRAAAQ